MLAHKRLRHESLEQVILCSNFLQDLILSGHAIVLARLDVRNELLLTDWNGLILGRSRGLQVLQHRRLGEVEVVVAVKLETEELTDEVLKLACGQWLGKGLSLAAGATSSGCNRLLPI